MHITGRRADGGAFSLDVTGTDVDLPAVAHLWARRRLSGPGGPLPSRAGATSRRYEAEIVALSTSHGVLSRFTAFLVVDDRQAVVSSAERRTIVQPVEMPHMWTAGASLDSAAPFAALQDGCHPGRLRPPGVLDCEASRTCGAIVFAHPVAFIATVLLRSRQRQIPAAPGSAGEATASDNGRIDEVTDLLERLLAALRQRAARAGAPTAPGEAFELVERLLALLAARADRNERSDSQPR